MVPDAPDHVHHADGMDGTNDANGADNADNAGSAKTGLPSESIQHRFQANWPDLTQPHVRNLAWLLDAPDLLQASHPRWQGRLAQLSVPDAATAEWIRQLDRHPEALMAFLALHPHTRLGHYAENLLAFYFGWSGQLVAHGLQVRSHTTIGEFDFLLHSPAGLQHWEFACKFYLLVSPETKRLKKAATKSLAKMELPTSADTAPLSDEFHSLSNYVGPNLSDNLGDKLHKIMDAQLSLGQHPAAQRYLTAPLVAARAWLKGWLFYPATDTRPLDGIGHEHCRGLWCHVSELSTASNSTGTGTGMDTASTIFAAHHFHILPRLNWLAPAKVTLAETQGLADLQCHLHRTFLTDPRPVLVAQCHEINSMLIEHQRIFIVPDGWGTEE